MVLACTRPQCVALVRAPCSLPQITFSYPSGCLHSTISDVIHHTTTVLLRLPTLIYTVKNRHYPSLCNMVQPGSPAGSRLSFEFARVLLFAPRGYLRIEACLRPASTVPPWVPHRPSTNRLRSESHAKHQLQQKTLLFSILVSQYERYGPYWYRTIT